MNLKPLGDRVVVKPVDKEEKTKSGIVLPDTAKEKPQEGIVQAVGTGRILDNGTKVPMELKVGDKVLYAKYAGNEFKIDEIEYLIVSEKDVLAVVGTNGKKKTKKEEGIPNGKGSHIRRRGATAPQEGHRHSCPGRPYHAWPEGPQRGPREEVRRPNGHQRRRDDRARDRAQGRNGEHRRAAPARGRDQDERRGR